MSETYPVKASITSLARTPDGTLWVGLFAAGPGLGLQARDVVGLRAELLRRRLVTPGSVVVFINVSHHLDRTDTNFLNLQQLI